MFKMGCSMARRILAIDPKNNNNTSNTGNNNGDGLPEVRAASGGAGKATSGDELNDFSKLEDDPRIPLNVRQIFKITKSWKAIARTMSKTGTAMFLNLFEQNEDLLYLFERFQHLKGTQLHESMELREHAATVMSTLDQSINSLSDYDNFVTYLHSIGKLHRKIPGFERDHFWKIEQPFLKAVKQTLDERCNDTIEEIYKIAIKLIIETIAEGYGQNQTASVGQASERQAGGGSGGGGAKGGQGGSATPGRTRPPEVGAAGGGQPRASGKADAKEGAKSQTTGQARDASGQAKERCNASMRGSNLAQMRQRHFGLKCPKVGAHLIKGQTVRGDDETGEGEEEARLSGKQEQQWRLDNTGGNGASITANESPIAPLLLEQPDYDYKQGNQIGVANRLKATMFLLRELLMLAQLGATEAAAASPASNMRESCSDSLPLNEPDSPELSGETCACLSKSPLREEVDLEQTTMRQTTEEEEEAFKAQKANEKNSQRYNENQLAGKGEMISCSLEYSHGLIGCRSSEGSSSWSNSCSSSRVSGDGGSSGGSACCSYSGQSMHKTTTSAIDINESGSKTKTTNCSLASNKALGPQKWVALNVNCDPCLLNNEDNISSNKNTAGVTLPKPCEDSDKLKEVNGRKERSIYLDKGYAREKLESASNMQSNSNSSEQSPKRLCPWRPLPAGESIIDAKTITLLASAAPMSTVEAAPRSVKPASHLDSCARSLLLGGPQSIEDTQQVHGEPGWRCSWPGSLLWSSEHKKEPKIESNTRRLTGYSSWRRRIIKALSSIHIMRRREEGRRKRRERGRRRAEDDEEGSKELLSSSPSSSSSSSSPLLASRCNGGRSAEHVSRNHNNLNDSNHANSNQCKRCELAPEEKFAKAQTSQSATNKNGPLRGPHSTSKPKPKQLELFGMKSMKSKPRLDLKGADLGDLAELIKMLMLTVASQQSKLVEELPTISSINKTNNTNNNSNTSTCQA